MKHVLFFAALCAATGLMGQSTIDFTGFNASGLEASPSGMAVLADGKLNSNIISFNGADAAKLANGVTTTRVTDGGVYALDRGNGDMALLIQQEAGVFVPGSVTFAYINNSSAPVPTVNVSLETLIFNDQDRSTTIELSVSTDGVNFGFVNGLGDNVRNTDAERAPRPTNGSSSISVAAGGLNIPPGGRFFVRIALSDNGGTGLYDEVAFDNLTVSNLDALPVSLTNLTATPNGKTVAINWSTGSESDNDFFAIERSLDGQHFSEIGRVKGNGTTARQSAYQFTDNAPVSGSNYYRLRQVDFSGAATLSDFVVAELVADQLSVYPNPAADRLFVRGTDLGAASIFDLNGRLLKQVPSTNGSIDVSALQAGTYLLRVAGNTTRFVVE